MAALVKGPTLGDLLKFELNASYNRETVPLKSGASYALGAVLGNTTAPGKYRLSPALRSPATQAPSPPPPVRWQRWQPPAPQRPASSSPAAPPTTHKPR